MKYIDPLKWDLSDRQLQCLTLAVDYALTSKEIGARLGLSFKTVEIHFARSKERMGARTRSHAMVLFDRHRRELAEAAELASQQARQQEQERSLQEARRGFVHCPTCGGAGFVRGAQ